MVVCMGLLCMLSLLRLKSELLVAQLLKKVLNCSLWQEHSHQPLCVLTCNKLIYKLPE